MPFIVLLFSFKQARQDECDTEASEGGGSSLAHLDGEHDCDDGGFEDAAGNGNGNCERFSPSFEEMPHDTGGGDGPKAS